MGLSLLVAALVGVIPLSDSPVNYGANQRGEVVVQSLGSHGFLASKKVKEIIVQGEIKEGKVLIVAFNLSGKTATVSGIHGSVQGVNFSCSQVLNVAPTYAGYTVCPIPDFGKRIPDGSSFSIDGFKVK